jgi:hypothetical protein
VGAVANIMGLTPDKCHAASNSQETAFEEIGITLPEPDFRGVGCSYPASARVYHALRFSRDFRLPGTAARARRAMARPNVIILRQNGGESP